VWQEAVEIKSEADGSIDLEALKAAVGADTAALMLTNPSTLGLLKAKSKPLPRLSMTPAVCFIMMAPIPTPLWV